MLTSAREMSAPQHHSIRHKHTAHVCTNIPLFPHRPSLRVLEARCCPLCPNKCPDRAGCRDRVPPSPSLQSCRLPSPAASFQRMCQTVPRLEPHSRPAAICRRPVIVPWSSERFRVARRCDVAGHIAVVARRRRGRCAEGRELWWWRLMVDGRSASRRSSYATCMNSVSYTRILLLSCCSPAA